MNKFKKGMSVLSLIVGFGLAANAQEAQDSQKDGFFRKAFRDMKESARLQREIDRTNFKAVKLESKAFYEEQKRLSKPSVRTAAEKERMQKELEAAQKRVEEAQAKVNAAKK